MALASLLWLQFKLTRVQRRALPAAQILYDTEDELERLDRESAQLVADLQNVPALSVDEAIAKLEVVAQVIEPDDYVDAHAVLAQTISELKKTWASITLCNLALYRTLPKDLVTNREPYAAVLDESGCERGRFGAHKRSTADIQPSRSVRGIAGSDTAPA